MESRSSTVHKTQPGREGLGLILERHPIKNKRYTPPPEIVKVY